MTFVFAVPTMFLMMHRHRAIAEAALIPVPHPKWGEVGRAIVVLKPGARLGGDELQDWLEPDAMKARLNEVSMDNWMFCVDEALGKSGYAREDLGFLNMIHVKPSAYWDMPQRLGLTEEHGVYNADYGHIGEQDSIINMIEGERQGRLRDGDLMIIIAAGIGYVWGASCVKWGLCDA